MADKIDKQQALEAQPVIPSGSRYKGKPSNFDPNFRHQTQVRKPGNPNKSGPTAKTLPGPQHSQGKTHPTPTKDEPIFKDAIFGSEIVVRENNMRITYTPSCAGIIPIVNDMWMEMRVDEQQIDKQMLVEGLRYYSTAILWLRMIQLKRGNNVILTAEEQQLLDICGGTNFNVPEPIYLYIKALGTIQTTSTGQTLIPEFPPLPTEQVENFTGFYGAIAANNHNLYEEIPCLGVMSQALCVALSDANVGRYPSALDVDNVLVNANLLGFEPLTARRLEGKNFFLNIGLTPDQLPVSIPMTGFNYDLVYNVSQWIGTTKTFKIQSVCFDTLGINGSQAQTIIQKPIAAQNIRNIMGEVRETSVSKESTTIFGLGYYTCFELYKISPNLPADNASIQAQVWCCQNFTGGPGPLTIPADYIANRNERRNLPPEFLSERFETISMQNGNLRRRTITNMVISRR